MNQPPLVVSVSFVDKWCNMSKSDYVRENILNIQKLMRELPLRSFETKELRHLLRLSKIGEYAKGQLITEQADADSRIYFLLSGKVRLENDADTVIEITDKKGEGFGRGGTLGGLIHSASAYADAETVCLLVDTCAFSNRLTCDEGANALLLLYRVFMEYIAIRLRLVNDELVSTKKEIERLTQEAQA